MLHLAASVGEGEVLAALALVAESDRVPTFDTVRELVRAPAPQVLPRIHAPTFDFQVDDALLTGRCAHD